MMTSATVKARKLRVGYYTPSDVARWLARWAIRSGLERVLEPSCGDGVFVEAAAKEVASHHKRWMHELPQVVGVELLEEEARKSLVTAVGILGERRLRVHCADFFEWVTSAEPQLFNSNDTCPPGLFDVVLGNPPFIRYQNFPEPSRTQAMRFMQAQGLRPNRLTNVWVPFVIAAISLLKEDGRLAMVIPAELLQVTYAAQLRQRLADSFHRITIYACNEMFFKHAEQEVVLVLAEGKLANSDSANKCDISLVEANSIFELLRSDPRVPKENNQPKSVQHDSEKWLKYFLNVTEIEFMRSVREHVQICELREHCSVDVGVVTGNNNFFLLNRDQVATFDIADFVVPLVGRSSQLSGAVLKAAELHAIAKSGKQVYLLNLSNCPRSKFTSGLRRLIAAGEKSGVHLGYKCRVRNPWYKVPAIWEPDCFFFRQIYDFPRVVVNKAGATSTDTIHRMRCKSSAERIASNMYTHLTAASAEIEGRSYGGGVLELEPTEAERLLVPIQLNGALPIKDADLLVRAGRIKEVLEQNDRLVLQTSLGLTKRDCAILKQVWTKMRDRRMSRRRRP